MILDDGNLFRIESTLESVAITIVFVHIIALLNKH